MYRCASRLQLTVCIPFVALIARPPQYTVSVEVTRSFMSKNIKKSMEFIVIAQPNKSLAQSGTVKFSLTPQSLENVKQVCVMTH